MGNWSKLGFRMILTAALLIAAMLLTLYNRYPGRYGFSRMSMENAEKLIEEGGDFVIVDVRDPSEFALGHIPGAVNIPLYTIGTDKPSQLPDPGQKILVYCRTGMRSMKACRQLVSLGYTDIVDIGGIMLWKGDKISGN